MDPAFDTPEQDRGAIMTLTAVILWSAGVVLILWLCHNETEI
jgi:hypothetical protein